MNIDKIPSYILDDLRERGMSDKYISGETPEYLFDEWCCWNGIIGYGSTLIDVIDDLREANK